MKKDISAIKFRLWCKNNKLSAQDIADVLKVKRSTIYGYWSGGFAVPDESKKILEQKFGLPIYEIFFDSELK
jgi:transcriptional regulator with XRE-family HTH domain